MHVGDRIRFDPAIADRSSVDLEPGQPSIGIRILDFRYKDGVWWVDLEGMAGSSDEVQFHGETLSKVDGARLVRSRGDVSTVAVDFPEGSGRKEIQIQLKR